MQYFADSETLTPQAVPPKLAEAEPPRAADAGQVADSVTRQWMGLRFAADFSNVGVETGQATAPAGPVTGVPSAPVRHRPRLLIDDLHPPDVGGEPLPLVPDLRLRLQVLADDPAVNDAVGQLLIALDKYTGTARSAEVWDYVVEQVKAFGAKLHKKGAPPELYTPSVAAALRALGADKKLTLGRQMQVLQRVFTHLLAATEKRLGYETDGVGNSEQEYDHLDQKTKRQIGGLTAYQDVRAALLATFGALRVGTAKALEKINTYYSVKIVKVTFLGHPAWVHQELGTALINAEKRLPELHRAAIGKQITSFDGVSVRPNANNQLYLSEHSFGAAIDINPELNPNVPNFPVRFIDEVTGADLLTTPGGRRKTDVFDLGEMLDELVFGNKDAALRELERLLSTSQQLVDIFKDDASLAAGMLAVARRMTQVPAGVKPEALLAAARQARSEGTMVRWMYSDPKLKLPRSSPEGTEHDALVAMLFPTAAGDWPAETKRHAVELLIQMVDVYERSFAKDKRGALVLKCGAPSRIAPRARALEGAAALPQLVAHGFVNLPAMLVSALQAPDGGDLRWLGIGEHTKDSMHFELKHRPPLE
jgi:hypothetical protein